MRTLPFMNKFSIRQKLVIAFSSILVLTALVGFQAQKGLHDAEDRIQKTKEVQKLVDDLYKMRVIEKDYLLTKNDKYVSDLNDSIKQINQEISIVRERFSQERNRQRMEQVQDSITNYQKIFISYSEIEKKKRIAMAQMRSANNIALEKASDIDKDQKEQLVNIRKEGEAFLADKLFKVESANSILRKLYQARALRIQLVQKNTPSVLKAWKLKNNELFENTRELKNKFVLKNNIDQANKILQVYRLYEDEMLNYLRSKNGKTYQNMIDAALEAEQEILAIVKDQKRQLDDARQENDRKIKDKITKAAGANEIIKHFLDARKNEKEVIISGEEKYLSAVRESINLVLQRSDDLKRSFIFQKNIDQIDSVITAVADYKTDFEQFVSLTKEQEKVRNDLYQSAIEAEKLFARTQFYQEQKRNEEKEESNFIVILVTVLAITMGIVLALLISDSISKPLSFAANVANKLAKGETDIEFSVNSNDESGQLLASMRDMINQLNLAKKDTSERDWVKTAQTEMAAVIREEPNINELLLKGLNFYEHKLDLQTAAIYLRNDVDDTFQIASHTGVKITNPQDNIVKMGEGLVGQCAAHKKESLISGDGEYDLKWEVNLGIATINLQHILCAPLVFERYVVGVIVLGKVKPFEEKHRELVNETTEALAIAVKSAHNQEQMKVLLDELKVQSEELKESKIVAEEADHAKSEFLANMSHEIRTPMNAIIGMTNLVMNTELNEKQYDYIVKIQHSANNLLGIINDILDYSKIEAGKMTVEKVEFNLFEVLNDIIPVVSQKAVDKNVELLVKVDPSIPENLIGDPLRISQVLINLMNNAIKFTDNGEVILELLSTSVNGRLNDIQFSIKDSGVGMTHEQVGRLFQSFSQADTSTTRKYGGTGLGLKISKEFVNMMGGDIHVESSPNQGSTFKFSLTLEESKANQNYQRIKNNKSIDGKKMLIVEDHEISSAILRDILESFHCDVTAVATAEKGIEELKRCYNLGKPYDFVLMDWKLPGMDGIEATRQIKSDQHLSVTPTVIMVSAFGDEEAMEAAEEAGAESFLHKPVTASTVLDSILRFVDGYTPILGQEYNTGTKYISGISDLENANILLVEDNLINQEIAEAFLTDIAVNVTIAENGQEAVDLVFANDYDCVLMDVQMPTMDGYEATKIIRDDGRFNNLPILAMTASAMLSDKEEALRVGMNDHIAKPIDVNILYKSLVKWVKPKKHGHKLNGDEFSVLEGVNSAVALKAMDGRVEFYKRMLAKFKEKYDYSLDDLHQLLAEDKMEDAIRYLHSLKGASLSIGAIRVGELSDTLEHDEDLTAANSNEKFSSLKVELKKVLESIEKIDLHEYEDVA